MSAVRRNDGRSKARKLNSSPYARPQNSGWSFSKLFEPLRRRVFGQPVENEDGGRGHQFRRSPSPTNVSTREEEPYVNVSDSSDIEELEPPRSPSTTTSPTRPGPVEGNSSTATLENVIKFLSDATGTSLKREEVYSLVSLIRSSIPGEQTISNSLNQSVGRPLNAIEVEGMISLLRKRIPSEKAEPFRFQSTTPSRGNSPFTFSPPPPMLDSSISSPRKTLTKNPNGVYRWEGAGSAKTPRGNRYASPAFGTSRLTPQKVKSRDNAALGESTKGDGKRRKVGEEKSSFSPSPSTPGFSGATQKLPFPISTPQTPRTNGSTAKLTVPVASPSRLRTPALVKPTAPSQPSPLRQAWSGSSNQSQEDLLQPEQQQTPPKLTKAANFMSELIKEVTPPKKPDLINPYQAASPLAKVGPPRRSSRRSRATGRPSVPTHTPGTDLEASSSSREKEKADEIFKDYPPQVIIEATVPKGSKRSRPPAYLEKSTTSERRRSSSPAESEQPPKRQEQYVVEEPEEDQEEPSRFNKKSKGDNGNSSGSRFSKSASPEIVIEEVEDIQMQSTDTADKLSSSSFGNGASVSSTNGFSSRSSFIGLKSAPSRPSKLRFSYQPEAASAPPSPTSVPDSSSEPEVNAPPPPTITSSFTSLPPAPSKLAPAPAPVRSMDEGVVQKPGFENVSVKFDPKAKALAMDVSTLPTFIFTISVKASDKAYAKAQEQAKLKPVSLLPTFSFSRDVLKSVRPATASTPQPKLFGLTTTGSKSTSAAPRPDADKAGSAAAVKGFDWSAAGVKLPATPSTNWSCPTCMLSNPDSAKEKCTVCEAPRPGAETKEAKTASKGFDWAAAGIKPSAPSGANWTCSTCMLSNPDAAKEKCTVCEAPRPGAAVKEAPKAFDWSAAGIKAPSTSGSAWTCTVCMLSNPSSATEKCTVCDTPR